MKGVIIIEPRRVLHVVGTMNMGGVQLMLMNYYRNINKEFVQFDFLVQGEIEGFFEKEIIKNGGKIFRIPSMNKNLFKYNVSLWKFFKKHDYKIIHIHQNFSNIYAAFWAKKTGIPLIISHSHAAYPTKSKIKRALKKLIQIILNKIVDYKFACSEAAAEWLYGESFESNKSIKIINNGINVSAFTYNQFVRRNKRKDLDIENYFVIGHVGSFTQTKNHKFIIRVFKEVYKKNPNTKLILVGDGSLKSEIQILVKNLNLSEAVIFLEKRTDINELLQAFDLFFFPSYHEGLGMALIEAQASGLVCLASNKITTESKVSNLIEYLDLEFKEDVWVDKILTYINGYERKDMSENIIAHGYDIREQALNLEKFYLSTY